MQDFDVVIIGAGGAGMMCAFNAGRRRRSVVLLDHNVKVGRKILISGGGRCNFTNINAGPSNYVSANPHFCKSALAGYTPDDFIALVERHRIRFHEKKLGQLFCNESSQHIVNMLVSECEQSGAAFRLGCRVLKIEKGDSFHIATDNGDYRCRSLVIATGGLSIPSIGASGFGYRVAEQFGLSIVKTSPALVGLNFGEKELKELAELAGVSIDSQVTCQGVSFRENILFTHTGLSGPAILQASLYWSAGNSISINLVPEQDLTEWLLRKKRDGACAELKVLVADLLPKRFSDSFCRLYLPSRPVSEIADKALMEFAGRIRDWQVKPAGTAGYGKAEVTRGGVATDDLVARSLEARKVPGLYFIGEVVDVTGQLGGYNFQWAWASGFAAAQYV